MIEKFSTNLAKHDTIDIASQPKTFPPCRTQNAERRTQNAWRPVSAILALHCGALLLHAQAPLYPDRYPDEDHGATRYREYVGQVVNTDGNPLSDVAFYAEQAPLGIYLTDKNTVHFTWADVVKDSIQPDSLFRVDMDFYNGLSVPPVAYGQTPDLANYYLGAFEATNVKAFHRVKYSSVWNGIDVHFHHGSTGPRMSFIVRPGASPGAIGLRFNGQDSLHVDWAGRLKIWLDNKWIEFQEAAAYQVGDTGNIMPVNWTANYDLVDGSPVVKFSFDTYDTERPLLIQIG